MIGYKLLYKVKKYIPYKGKWYKTSKNQQENGYLFKLYINSKKTFIII
jgi:hypothetical protein